MKYRKKPIVIDAFQLTSENIRTPSDWPRWAEDALRKRHVATLELVGRAMVYSEDDVGLDVITLEGVMFAGLGSYIIKGVDGELYPCREDIFDATYEEA